MFNNAYVTVITNTGVKKNILCGTNKEFDAENS